MNRTIRSTTRTLQPPKAANDGLPVIKRFTVEEYLRFERASTAKSEFVNGQIYAMAGGTSDHARIVVNMAVRLGNQLEDGDCDVWTSDFRIAVSPTGPEFYPDLSVTCGEPQFLDDTQDCALNPVVLFEVLSKSTAKYDRETKVAWYREIPAARHIVLVSQHIIAVEHYVRLSTGVDPLAKGRPGRDSHLSWRQD